MSLFSATRPHSVGLALNDSPAGLAAYILEKFAMWSGCKTTDTAMCVESSFSKDDLLTNLMIYWATHSITSSIRLYYEDMHSPNVQIVGRLVKREVRGLGTTIDRGGAFQNKKGGMGGEMQKN